MKQKGPAENSTSENARVEEVMSWDQNAIDDFLHEGNIGNSSHTLLPGSPGAPAGSVSGKDSVRSLRTPTMTRSRSHSAISVASNISRMEDAEAILVDAARNKSEPLGQKACKDVKDFSPPVPLTQLMVPKHSLPASLKPYVNEALEVAGEQLGRSPSLRKISIVRTPSMANLSECGTDVEVGGAKSGGAGGLGGLTAGLFRRRKKNHDEEEETAIVFAFDEGTNIKKSDSQSEVLDGLVNPLPSPNDNISQNMVLSNVHPKISVTSADYSRPPSSAGTQVSSTEGEDSGINMRKVSTNGNLNERFDPLALLSTPIPPQSPDSSVITSSQLMLRRQMEDTLKEQALKQRFWDYMTMVMSMIYAVALVVAGLTFYLMDIFVSTESGYLFSEIFNIYLALVGMAWLIWLQVDISRYVNMMKAYETKQSANLSRMKLVEGPEGELFISVPIASKAKKLPQYYCFSTGRHSGSFFLKMGAAFFSLGHIVHVGLLLGKQIVYFTEELTIDGVDESKTSDLCTHTEALLFGVLQPFFIFLQLYMVFKYSNVIVNRSKGLARFALMHCIGTSLCFWLYAITNEVIDSIVYKEYFYEKVYCEDGSGYAGNSSATYTYPLATDRAGEADLRTCYEGLECFEDRGFSFSFDISCLLSKQCACSESNDIAEYIFKLSPYLYPFSIEFSILVVAVWYIMWSNIGKVEENRRNMELMPTTSRRDSLFFDADAAQTPKNDALYIYADCHSSMKGLFFGLSFFVLAVIGIIVFFIMSVSDDCRTQQLSGIINNGFEIGMEFVMAVVAAWVYYQLSTLDVNPHPISFLDDLLLFICIPSFFLYVLVDTLPKFQDVSYLPDIISQLIMLVQMVIQTPMIMDGLRRCSDSSVNQDRRPGRNLVAFLLISNLAIYFWETLEVKNISHQAVQKEFYGDILWTLLSHITLPLVIFYRFHSSVALADIWGSAYKPGDHD